MIVEATQRFWNGAAKVPSFGSEMDPFVRKYLKGLERFTRFVIDPYPAHSEHLPVESCNGMWSVKGTWDEIIRRSNVPYFVLCNPQRPVPFPSTSSTTMGPFPIFQASRTATEPVGARHSTLCRHVRPSEPGVQVPKIFAPKSSNSLSLLFSFSVLLLSILRRSYHCF